MELQSLATISKSMCCVSRKDKGITISLRDIRYAKTREQTNHANQGSDS